MSDTIRIELINVPVPVIVATGDLLKVNSNIYSSYEWFKNNVAIPNSNSAQIVVNQPGSYTVKVITAASCSITSIAYIYNSGGTGIDDLQLKNGLLILYPNPAENSININSDAAWTGPVEVSVTDVLGKIVSHKIFPSSANGIIFDIGVLNAGIYQVTMSDGKLSRHGRFVKK